MFSRDSKPVLLDFLLEELARGLTWTDPDKEADPVATVFREQMSKTERKRRVGQLSAQRFLDTAGASYVPYGSNREAFDSTGKEVLLSGAAGTGKSRAWLEKMHSCAQQYPGFRGLIVRKTRESLSEAALFTFEEHVLGRYHPILQSGGQRRNRQKYVYPNGSEIVIGGLDKAGKIMSTEFDMIYVQEAIDLGEDDWESLTSRLRNYKMPYQQIGGDTNPSFPQHWLKQRCDHGQTQLIFCQHEDNPRLFDPATQQWTREGLEYIATLDALTGVRKLRLRYGKWVQAEGAVYDTYDERVHLIDRFDIPQHWRRFRAIDFGYTNPFVCLWAAQDDDGRLYIYREIYRSKPLVEDHAADINQLSEGENIEWTVADHDAEDRATLDRHGIPTDPAEKNVKAGIQAVQERLRIAGDGKPRLFLMRDSLVERDEELSAKKRPVSIVEEFPAYMWVKDSGGKAAKEEPVKLDDHAMDTLRYLIAAFDLSNSEWGFDIA